MEELLERHTSRQTVDGKAGVVRNGYLPERELQTGLGPVTVKIPKVRARTGEPVTYISPEVDVQHQNGRRRLRELVLQFVTHPEFQSIIGHIRTLFRCVLV